VLGEHSGSPGAGLQRGKCGGDLGLTLREGADGIGHPFHVGGQGTRGDGSRALGPLDGADHREDAQREERGSGNDRHQRDERGDQDRVVDEEIHDAASIAAAAAHLIFRLRSVSADIGAPEHAAAVRAAAVPVGPGDLPRLSSDARFVPEQALAGRPHVTVDGAGGAQSVLSLAHWPGNTTPPMFAAETATRIVDLYLRAGPAGPEVDAVTNNHYDVDGLLAAWLLLEHPAERSPERPMALAAAEAGDFGTWTDPWAMRIALALMAFAEPATTPLESVRRLLSPTLNHDPAGELSVAVLPRVRRVLADPERFRLLWQVPWDAIDADIALLDSGVATIEEVSKHDLAIVRASRLLAREAVHPRTACSRVLDVLPDGTLIFRYRYETWVTWSARPTMPRRDLTRVVDALNAIETAPGTWRFEGIAQITPRMYLADANGRPAPSKLTVAQVVDVLEP
jgi:hypothetical protein